MQPISTSAMEFAKPCQHCGMIHDGVCSRVKSIEYYPDGTMKRVEYHDEYTSRECLMCKTWGPGLVRESEDAEQWAKKIASNVANLND